MANALAEIDRSYNRDCLIIADLSADPTYAETLFDTFGRRLVGVRIGASGDGTTFEQRRVRNCAAVPVYNVGRTYLFELLLGEMWNHRVRFADSAESTRAYAQLVALEPEQRENHTIYHCPSGKHDDLAISLAMLAWAAQHVHFDSWTRPIFDAHRPRKPRQKPNSAAWT